MATCFPSTIIQHDHVGELVKFASHIWRLKGGTYLCCLVDFREEPPDAVQTEDIGSDEECDKRLEAVTPLVKLPCSYVGDFRSSIPASPFNISFLEGIPIGERHVQIRQRVIESMKNGYESGYRGGAHYLRDFASDLSPDKENDAFKRLQEEVKKGYCIGPFDLCPFPNSGATSKLTSGNYSSDGRTSIQMMGRPG